MQTVLNHAANTLPTYVYEVHRTRTLFELAQGLLLRFARVQGPPPSPLASWHDAAYAVPQYSYWTPRYCTGTLSQNWDDNSLGPCKLQMFDLVNVIPTTGIGQHLTGTVLH